jgi:hypothetical protein
MGYETLIDDSDVENLSRYSWRALIKPSTVYAVTSVTVAPNHRKTVYMHRLILSAKDGFVVDHIDGNGLNNTRQNLREVTPAENQANRQHKTTGSSSLLGVTWHSGKKKWEARLQREGKAVFLGSFAEETEAAEAYLRAREACGMPVWSLKNVTQDGYDSLSG